MFIVGADTGAFPAHMPIALIHLLISANNKTRAREWLPGKYSVSSSHLPISPRPATPRPWLPVRSIILHREEDRRSRWSDDIILTPSRDIWEYIFRRSITRRSRTVRRWLIMMMTSRHRVQWGHHRHNCLRPSDLHMVSHSQICRRLPNARQ